MLQGVILKVFLRMFCMMIKLRSDFGEDVTSFARNEGSSLNLASLNVQQAICLPSQDIYLI